MGLRTMKYRANAIGAQFAVQPAEGGGTVVSCLLPITNPTTKGVETCR
jgi:signal transduction histidine kinase